jgi:hypothetical protein
MSKTARICKVFVAMAVAFAPSLTAAYASSGKARINVQVLSLEELKSEFGAGGGGGGETPPSPCPESAGVSTQAIRKCGEEVPPPVETTPAPNWCTWDRDNDYKCDTISYSAVLDNISESSSFVFAGAWSTCTVSSLTETNYCSGSNTYSAPSVTLTGTFSGQFTTSLNAGFELNYTAAAISVSPNYRIALGMRVRLEVYNLYYNKSGHEDRIYSDADGFSGIDYRVGSWSGRQYFGRSVSNVIGVAP